VGGGGFGGGGWWGGGGGGGWGGVGGVVFLCFSWDWGVFFGGVGGGVGFGSTEGAKSFSRLPVNVLSLSKRTGEASVKTKKTIQPPQGHEVVPKKRSGYLSPSEGKEGGERGAKRVAKGGEDVIWGKFLKGVEEGTLSTLPPFTSKGLISGWQGHKSPGGGKNDRRGRGERIFSSHFSLSSGEVSVLGPVKRKRKLREKILKRPR